MRPHPGIGIALAAALILGGCGNDVDLPSEAGPTTSPAAPAREIAELLAAPDSIVSGGARYRAIAFVYRDFMPGWGERDHRARAGVRVRSADVDTIPASLHPRYVWVIHGPEVWGAEMEYRYSTPRSANFQAEARAGAHGGPEWPVGDSIQVITGIPDSTGFIRLLRCPDTVIDATS